jgi:hypothetical protein
VRVGTGSRFGEADRMLRDRRERPRPGDREAATVRFVTPAETVLDPGPLPYARIDLYGDPDLEHALREEGLDPQATTTG